MIVTVEGGELRVITQSDHAHFAAELLSLWRSDALPEHPRRQEILFATREHDNGWREADAAPHLDHGTGRPHDFMSMPAAERCEIWRRGVRRHAGERPYAALLITHHARHLHRDRQGEAAYAELFEELDALYRELAEETGADIATVEGDYRFLELADLLSLMVCNRWREDADLHGVSGRYEDGTLTLSPFPLAGATRFRIPVRHIPDRPYASATELAVELATARWGRETVRVSPIAASSIT